MQCARRCGKAGRSSPWQVTSFPPTGGCSAAKSTKNRTPAPGSCWGRGLFDDYWRRFAVLVEDDRFLRRTVPRTAATLTESWGAAACTACSSGEELGGAGLEELIL